MCKRAWENRYTVYPAAAAKNPLLVNAIPLIISYGSDTWVASLSISAMNRRFALYHTKFCPPDELTTSPRLSIRNFLSPSHASLMPLPGRDSPSLNSRGFVKDIRGWRYELTILGRDMGFLWRCPVLWWYVTSASLFSNKRQFTFGRTLNRVFE
jgi:hypothetical protein